MSAMVMGGFMSSFSFRRFQAHKRKDPRPQIRCPSPQVPGLTTGWYAPD